MSAFIDLHCHILPGLDDGPTDLETAMSLVQGLESLGFNDFYPTPHQKAGSFAPSQESAEQAAAFLQDHLKSNGSQARIHSPAGENMWDELFLNRQDGSFPSYPGGRAFLIEFRQDSIPPAIEERLFGYRVGGKLPVLAHVERYGTVARDFKRLEKLSQSTALLVNLSCLGGMEGWRLRRLARRLVVQRLVHAVSSDGHGQADIPFCKAGLEWIRSTLGENTLKVLLEDNPRRILAGELPEW